MGSPTTVYVDTRQPRSISTDLWGVFFEDLSYAADGGLSAELVQNGAFEYSQADQSGWHALTAWEIHPERDAVRVETADPVHPHQPYHLVVRGQVTLVNRGFGGMPVRAGERYVASAFVRDTVAATGLVASILRGEGTPLATAPLAPDDGPADPRLGVPPAGARAGWRRWTTTLVPAESIADARFALAVTGTAALDQISLQPVATFKGRANGMRADLAAAIAALRPRFVRFPGGCVAHGLGLANMYRWKDTIGPVAARRPMPNLWGYHQSMRIGYDEYFRFCEDLEATPLPVVAAGVCCQNTVGGPQPIPMLDMPAYVQEVLDLVEYANGSPDHGWGAVRAANGHPQPYRLRYLGVGNEDEQTGEFRTRFAMIHDALRAAYPELAVIGTAGPSPAGAEFDAGWAFARERSLDIVDEHAYKSPRWYLQNIDRYDTYDRTGPAVYVGEYSARINTARGALAEAAFMCGLERNGDIVRLASYAPLLAHTEHTHWLPDLIYFDGTHTHRTLNYHVQRMHAEGSGDQAVPVTVEGAPAPAARRTESVTLSIRAEGATLELDDVHVNGVPVEAARSIPPHTAVALATLATSGTVTLSARVRRVSGDDGYLVAASADQLNGFEWEVGSWRNRSSRLARRDDGISHDLADPVPFSVRTGTWTRLELTIRDGSTLDCRIDGRTVHRVVDDQRPEHVFVATAVRDRRTNATTVKIVNFVETSTAAHVVVDGVDTAGPARRTTLSVPDPDLGEARAAGPVEPVHDSVAVRPTSTGTALDLDLPPWSFTVVRLAAMTDPGARPRS